VPGTVSSSYHRLVNCIGWTGEAALHRCRRHRGDSVRHWERSAALLPGRKDAGNVGLQCLGSGEWIWADLKLSTDDVDIYARPPESERRLVSRVNCFLSAEVVCDRAGQKTLALVRDLSLGGCYVAMTFPFPLEARVSIAVWLDERTKVWINGIVISSHASTGMGVKFVDVSHANLLTIDRFLKNMTEPDAPSVRIWVSEK
jgi:PilZ domain